MRDPVLEGRVTGVPRLGHISIVVEVEVRIEGCDLPFRRGSTPAGPGSVVPRVVDGRPVAGLLVRATLREPVLDGARHRAVRDPVGHVRVQREIQVGIEVERLRGGPEPVGALVDLHRWSSAW